MFYPFVAWAKEMAAWAYGVVFDLLAAQAKEIVAMWTLTVLPALLAPVMSRSAVGMGGFVADRQWFCAMLAWMDFCCFNSSFHRLYFDSSSYWGRYYGQ